MASANARRGRSRGSRVALRSLSLCSGIGGLDLGLGLARWCRTVCYVERDSFAASVLVARMEEAELDRAPIWNDLRSFDGRAWRGAVDLVVGGYPCQPFSAAGKRQGANDERHLWPEIRRILEEVAPPLAFFENVRGHLSLGFADVLGDLAALGFDAEWGVLAASDVGAPHKRERLFVLAHRHGGGREKLKLLCGRESVSGDGRADLADAAGVGRRSPRGASGDGRRIAGDEGSGVADASLGEARRSRIGRTPSDDHLALAHPDDPQRRPSESSGDIGHGHDAGRDQEAGGSPGNGAALADSGLRRRVVAERIGDEAESASSAAGESLGDADLTRTNARAEGGGSRRAARESGCDMEHADGSRRASSVPRRTLEDGSQPFPPGPRDGDGWREWIERGGPQPVLRRGADGPSAFVDRADRLRCLGNAVVPAQAEAAFALLAERVMRTRGSGGEDTVARSPSDVPDEHRRRARTKKKARRGPAGAAGSAP